jgi:arsenate reductase
VTETGPVRVLFLCTHNSARSQMAEGILRHLGGDRFAVESAGSEPRTVHSLTTRVMDRLGIDIGGQRSKHLDSLERRTFDYVVTVCDNANETCPLFPGTPRRIHWSIADPSQVAGPEPERLAAFERAADDLTGRIRAFIAEVRTPATELG